MNNETYSYKYPHPALTADCVIFGFDGIGLKVLLIERGVEPFKGMWALPGGFMRINETIEQAARRELAEETGLRHIYMEQFKVFSDVNRDPRERVVTVAFMALVRPADYRLIAGDDAVAALWFDENALPPLAFDHMEIILQAREHLKEVLRIKPVAFELLNKVFSLSELQKVYEVINRTHYDRRNFQRKALQTGMLQEVDRLDVSMCLPAQMSTAMSDTYFSPDDEEKDIFFGQSIKKSSSARRSTGRPTSKLFSFMRKKKDDEEDEKGESSTRDIFDY